jgi:CBS domain-containing protein
MPTVRDLLARKGTGVVTMTPSQTVLDAAHTMNDHGIGGVLVMDGATLAGIFTERDIMRRVVAANRDPATTILSDVMTTQCLTVSADSKVADVRALMTTRRIRHLPVVSGDGIVGVVTAGDVLAFEVAQHAARADELEKYVFNTR